jgi:hypothetical protein
MKRASKQVGRGMSGSWLNPDEGQQMTPVSLHISVFDGMSYNGGGLDLGMFL